MLERALRRSGLPVSFTGGFHPLPRLQLALPLPLSVEGLGEWFDLEFAVAIDPDSARARLQEQLPAGLTLLSVAAVPVQGPSLSQELRAARWSIELLPPDSDAAAGSLAEAGPWPEAERWQQAIAGLLAAESLPWQDTDKKGRPRSRDCRPYLTRLELEAWTSGPPMPSVRLQLEAAIDPAGRSLRPELLQVWLAQLLGVELRLGRQSRLGLLLQAW